MYAWGPKNPKPFTDKEIDKAKRFSDKAGTFFTIASFVLAAVLKSGKLNTNGNNNR